MTKILEQTVIAVNFIYLLLNVTVGFVRIPNWDGRIRFDVSGL